MITIGDLKNLKCIPCEGNVSPFTAEDVHVYGMEVPEWKADAENKKISREFKFADFIKAMAFVDAVADIAESEGHHPDIHISYNRVLLELSTHSIGGLSENDFIVAAKIDQLHI
jgi:4a-hydroxytetrahydrobiopterin dehydratase